ncbi:uncharacterized protein LAESUDRAFT_673257 [Laetiporus sulphureus 93-53]|uniref:Oxidase ustYa n=1 Tax=Laetiporus sulphureus 93-53 TaxID=1314785 RepID=A0A165GKU7_9APHY|nr:uncharacterized protein LAESUDRAFT_673257 [Laetiporus sulphureus 93-53]KZT10490.1 hypothetical protein LAESUDRAFT_673257 [Laetiporus sulphureus 93-53]
MSFATKRSITLLNRYLPSFAVLWRCCVLAALTVSMMCNILTGWWLVAGTTVDDSGYSYIGDDHPIELPVRLDTVAMTFNNSDHYTISLNQRAPSEWLSLTKFPKGNATVRLGSNGREFGISMFRQLDCLNTLRKALIHRAPDKQSGHCLNYMRQAVLCASDITLDPLLVDPDGKMRSTDGVGVDHVCKDWTQVYAFVNANQQGPHW